MAMNPTDGQIIQLPMTYGERKNKNTLDYDSNLPENMLAVSREIKGAAGYMRMYPGIKKKADVDGISRGVEWNTVKDSPYRTQGGRLYLNGADMGSVPGEGRVSMAHSRASQGVVSEGKLRLYRYDGETKIFENWDNDGQEPTTYDWGIIDSVCHFRQRYIFSSGAEEFWISDLTDESRPDYNAPYYRAETMPDGIVAVKSFRDFVVCFGKATVEFFTLTGNDGTIGPVFQSQPAYMGNFGIIGRDAVCYYAESFAFITSPATGIVTIGVMNATGGSWADIASSQVKKILASYTSSQLKDAICESIQFKSYNLLIVHLPNETLVYDGQVSQQTGVHQWCYIKSGINGINPHRAIDYINEGSEITCGDKIDGTVGSLDETTITQYGKDQEIVVYSQPVAIENAILNDLEVDSNSGGSSVATRIFISASEDAVNWGMERPISFDKPQQWVKRVILRRVCRVRTSIAFKLRVVGATPVTISRLRVRVS